MDFLPTFFTKSVLCAFLLGFCNASLFSQRWERVYSEYPIEGECAFGIDATADGGFLLLASRGFDASSAQMTYFMKVDADGAVQWKHDVVLGGAVKFSKITNGNYAILSRRRNVADSTFSYFYTICTPTGNVLATDSIAGADLTDVKASFLTPIHHGLGEGGFAVACKGVQPGPNRVVFIRTFDAAGQPLNAFPTYEINPDSFTIRCIVQGPGDNYYGVGYFHYPFQRDFDAVWFKMKNNGHMPANSVKVFDDTPGQPKKLDVFHDVTVSTDGNLWVLNLQNAAYGPFLDKLFLLKMDTAGNVLQNKQIATHISNLDFAGLDRSKIVALPDGGAAILYESHTPGTNGEDFSLARVDANANLLWTRHFGRPERFAESPFDLVRTADGGFALAGWFNDTIFHSNDAYLVRTDQNGWVNTDHISGQLFSDANANCQKDPGEPPLGSWLVRLERNGKPALNVLTGPDGKYSMPTDTGLSVVRIIPAANYWEPCQDTAHVVFTTSFDSATVDFPVKPVFNCPQLEVDIVAPFLRRCFNSTYKVIYANRGTVAANNVTVQVKLDPNLDFKSSNGNWTYLGNNEFSFAIGSLGVGNVGSFEIYAEVNCNATLGATHCTEARIFPNGACSPPPGWSGASIRVDGDCSGPTVDFKVRNGGTGNISEAVEFVIIEDHIIDRQGFIYNLPPGQDTTLHLPANGSTWRIETSQEPGHPGTSKPAVAVEGCGVDSSGGQSLGYITIFPDDDGDPYVSMDCQQNIGSFDPNDKSAYPQGVGNEHFILPETELEYLIRFQNTGTDTAFSVVIRDTLSYLLDLRSVRPGPSSHKYSFEIQDDRTLKFFFKNILLPDSNVNLAASNGFVKYTVRHLSGIPLGSVITNRAAILFDFNEPVITNQTWHTVDTGFLEVVTIGVKDAPGASVLPLEIRPNPVSSRAWIEIRAENFSKNLRQPLLRIRSMAGASVFETPFLDGKCQFDRQGVEAGFYFVEILDGGRLVASGKLILR